MAANSADFYIKPPSSTAISHRSLIKIITAFPPVYDLSLSPVCLVYAPDSADDSHTQ